MNIVEIAKVIQPFAAVALGFIGSGFTVYFAIERTGDKVKARSAATT